MLRELQPPPRHTTHLHTRHQSRHYSSVSSDTLHTTGAEDRGGESSRSEAGAPCLLQRRVAGRRPRRQQLHVDLNCSRSSEGGEGGKQPQRPAALHDVAATESAIRLAPGVQVGYRGTPAMMRRVVAVVRPSTRVRAREFRCSRSTCHGGPVGDAALKPGFYGWYLRMNEARPFATVRPSRVSDGACRACCSFHTWLSVSAVAPADTRVSVLGVLCVWLSLMCLGVSSCRRKLSVLLCASAFVL